MIKQLFIFLLAISSQLGLMAQFAPGELVYPPRIESSIVEEAPVNSESASLRGIDPIFADKLQHTLDSMHNVLGIKGLSAAIRLPGGEIWGGASGVSSESPLDSMTKNHRLAMGSVTKTMVSAVILQLAEEGELELEDQLNEWLPTYNDVNDTVTIRQLLQHRSGIYNFTNHPNFNTSIGSPYMNQIWTPEEVIAYFVNAQIFNPGASFSYSNTNYLLLGLIIEAATGQSFHEAMRERLIEPFELNQTFLPIAEPWQSPVGHLWLDLNNNNSVVDFHQTFYNWTALHTSTAAAGGYFSTPSDLVEWMYQYQAGDALGEAIRAEMQTVIPAPGLGSYGLGTSQRTIGGYTAIGHGGDISYSTASYYFPNEEVAISVQANDGRVISWNLDGTLVAIMNTYLNCDQTTSTQQVQVLSPEAIFPNPFKEDINIQLPLASPASIEVYDSRGQQVAQWIADDGRSIRWAGQHQSGQALPSGTYFFRIQQAGQVYTARAMKF